ncbi:sulfite exporter TauE/SafE family protein [Anoxybacteroides amylolyticum]|uniref:Probable membrane transporter protein n=1 Tax=Anoxybacteroides amylolyticum TaxID=294699 RepID=A0A167T6H6_9BACL|nr:sulfite exporter TauE/SafE family protein [Anoxybacillus amylolyticus]ANB59526.1 sulfite exporter TauE/SafE family protein [Anoxybacillus amylolyticus]
MYALLLLVGFLAGTIGSLVGLGGGVIIVPSLLFLGASHLIPTVSPQVAVGTSLVVIIFNGLSSTLSYMKDKMVDYRSGLLFFIGSGPGAMLGAWANQSLSLAHFSLYFGLFLISVSFLLMFTKKSTEQSKQKHFRVTRTYITNEGDTVTYGYHPMTAISIAFMVGFFGGIFGIGGGSLMVPAMILLFFFPPHVAVATSMFIVFLSSLVSSVTHMVMGNVQWWFVLLLVPGVWFGAKTGAWMNKRLKSKTIVFILRVVLILLGVRLIIQGIS